MKTSNGKIDSMSDIPIRTENLGKLYRIGEHHGGYKTLRESIVRTLSAPFHRLSRNPQTSNLNPQSDHIWALKNVSFEVRRGEVIGIIGRNGAGKTTLLKILSRITEPTEGWAEIRGRVGSLLEVGTGFHPELTGRENIYLNGAILGMRKVEINRKFDEIVAFAEIEKFIDTPVKRYSSGMYVRLAFAVAAHLEPEILLVDEVLAVGDAVFQKKCLGKMGQVAGEGRTVLFVSHNMSAVQRLCKRVYLLEEGKIITSGDAAPVVDAYYRFTMDRNDPVTETRDVPEGTVRFLKWGISRSSAGDPYSCYTGEPCTISLQVVARRVVRKASFGIALWSNDGILIWAMRNLDHGGEHAFLQEGLYQIDFSVPQFPVKPGSYQIQVSVNDDFGEGALDIWYAQPKFVILPKKESGISRQWQGIVNISGEFSLSLIGNHGTGVGSS